MCFRTFYGRIRIWNRIRTIWLDPDPAKRFGSERIRIRNTVGTYAFETGSGLTVLINALVILSNIRSQIRSKGSTWAGPAYPSQPYTD